MAVVEVKVTLLPKGVEAVELVQDIDSTGVDVLSEAED